MEYINECWSSTLRKNNVDSFEALWELKKDTWFEAPNYRRGGWSGACKTTLTLPEGGEVGVFIKRQENHFYRSWRHLFRQRPTFEREYLNILSFHKKNIPTTELIYFGSRKVNGNSRSLLITRELKGYLPLGDNNETTLLSKLSLKEKRQLLENLASALRLMHANHFQHNSLYPKHIFIGMQEDNLFKTCFIDLEKARRRLFKRFAAIKDLGIMYRRTKNLKKTDYLRFFLSYLQEKKLSKSSKNMIRAITKNKLKNA